MPKRGNLALAACEACRHRKVRCDSVRPVCGACLHRDSACSFPSEPGLTRTAALKSEVSQLKTIKTNLLELYRQLRDGTASDAWRLVEQIRAGEVPVDVPPRTDVSTGAIQALPPRPSGLVDALDPATGAYSRRLPQLAVSSSKQSSQTTRIAKRHAVLQRPLADPIDRGATVGAQFTAAEPGDDELLTAIEPGIDEPSTVIELENDELFTSIEPGNSELSPYQPFEQLDLSDLMYDEEDSDASLQSSLQANLAMIQQGFEVQQSCISEIFSCHSKETFEALISCLKQDYAAPPDSSVLCEICAVATIAGQYVRDSIGSSVLDHWYSSSRQRFEDCIDVDPVSAIKVAAMLGLYNLLRRSSVAMNFFETGISLSIEYLREHTNRGEPVVNLEVLSTVRTQRSLVFCHGWLQATLGNDCATTAVSMPSGSMKPEEAMAIQETESLYSSEHDLVHGVAATIAILKATAMRMLWACSDVPGLLHSLQDLQEQLGDWYGHLPGAAQLVRLGDNAQTPLKSSIYYVHLLHLGAVMLMFRHCLAGLQFSGDRESLSTEQRSTMNAALNDGVQAAQHSARMTYLIQRFSRSVEHCWTMIYQAYVSGMILIFHAAQLKLAGFSEKHGAMSFDLASKVLDGLNFCKELSPVARKLTATLTGHYESLRDADSSANDAEESEDVSPPQSGEYLFNASPESADLHDTSCELFEQLCNPYTDGETLAAQNEKPLVWSPRSHKTSRFPWKSRCWQGYMGSGFGEAPVAITPEISNLEDGYFFGSRDPSWWLGKRVPTVHPYASRTLEVS